MNQTQLIGVLNLTPDSFSDGGQFLDRAKAIAHAHSLIAAGATIVDVGAEATGPGSKPIDVKTELTRLGDIVREHSKHARISVDTYKSAVADSVLQQGAAIINDTSALRADKEMAAVLRSHNAQVILMYAKDSPRPHVSTALPHYKDVVAEIAAFLKSRADFALTQGLTESQIILDPGMGRFLSDEPQVSWELLARFDELVSSVQPFPVVVGTSRKGFLATALNATPSNVAASERDPLSCLTALHAVQRGASFVRTHNVSMMRGFLDAATLLNESANAHGN